MKNPTFLELLNWKWSWNLVSRSVFWQNSFLFKKFKTHNHLRFSDVFWWQDLLMRMTMIEIGEFIHGICRVQTTTTSTCHSYWNNSLLTEALVTSDLLPNSAFRLNWVAFCLFHTYFLVKKWISAMLTEVQGPPLFLECSHKAGLSWMRKHKFEDDVDVKMLFIFYKWKINWILDLLCIPFQKYFSVLLICFTVSPQTEFV